MKAIGYSLLILVAACAWAAVAGASWSYDPEENNAVCTEPGDQSAVRVACDGAGGYIAV